MLLSLLTLQRVLDSRELVYSTARHLATDTNKCETDLVVFSTRGHRSGLHVVIGEIKDESGRINKVDIDNLLTIRERLAAKGLKVYLLFAKTANAFLDVELGAFKVLRQQDIPFILFTNRELEPYHPYWEDEDTEQLPHKYALALEEMAENGYFRYLGL